jgi:hypothetical protein
MTATKTANLSEGLIYFWQNCPVIRENAKGVHGSKYADLQHLLSVIRPTLCNAGLSVLQLPDSSPSGAPALRTIIRHISGEQVESTTPLTVKGGGNPLHDWGGAVTYARRYALNAALLMCEGIADDDGGGGEAVSQAPPKAAVFAPAPHTPAQTQQPDPLAPAVDECIEVIQEWSKQAQTNGRNDLIDELMGKVAEMNGGKPAKFKQVLDSIQKIEDLTKWAALNPPLALEAAK